MLLIRNEILISFVRWQVHDTVISARVGEMKIRTFHFAENSVERGNRFRCEYFFVIPCQNSLVCRICSFPYIALRDVSPSHTCHERWIRNYSHSCNNCDARSNILWNLGNKAVNVALMFQTRVMISHVPRVHAFSLDRDHVTYDFYCSLRWSTLSVSTVARHFSIGSRWSMNK